MKNRKYSAATDNWSISCERGIGGVHPNIGGCIDSNHNYVSVPISNCNDELGMMKLKIQNLENTVNYILKTLKVS